MKKEDWISVNETLPKEGDLVIVHCPMDNINGHVLLGRIYNEKNGKGKWTVYDTYGEVDNPVVTHWMPYVLPY